MSINRHQRSALFLITITFIAFISLGSPDGLLDIANPRIRDTFNIGPDVFSLIFITGVIGYSSSSFFAGQLVSRLGIGLLLAASCMATGLALLGNAIAPAWLWFVLIGLLGGAGAGAIDTGLNTYVATNYGPRLMFWLHASFGLGVTGGTWVMSLVVNSGQPWRWGYAIVGIFQLLLALTFLLTRQRWNNPHPEIETPADQAQAAAKPTRIPIRTTLRVPIVWFGILMFFLYTGIEVSAGRWATTLFIDGRTINAETAGFWVSAYWGFFTIGRVLAGFVGRWLTPLAFLRLSMIGAVIAAALLVANPVSWSGGLALGLMGISFAPIFPMMISATPGRVGSAHAPNTIGFQIAGAGLGVMVIPGLIGVLAKTVSIEAMPVLLLIISVTILALHEIIVRHPYANGVRVASAPEPEPELIAAQGDR